ncbi:MULTISPECIES: hypothetical protein [unclassified Beijerinckia]|uniref:hypothetical protein n=1 Tax=unclassified Beijerinckia TaxID=2638183 RepID=UPI000894621A|nr:MULTISPECIES: hypothetical protein [unclassified Beijerinckia]MDH7797504.1 hypothetical protein [Beijerinckia sp. GAS462]SEC88228.1 hypothetical protein SAMN05443249_3798 [Beijerinckia sp. 28-YEA-48]
MTRRTKRSFDEADAQRMLGACKAFQQDVRVWMSQMPLRTAAYVGLCALNQSLEIARCAVQGDCDELIRNNYDSGPPE